MSRKSQRSRVEMFRKDFITLARECGGSYATKADRVRIAKYFLNYLRENGIKLRDTHSINTRHFQGYLLSRKAQGISHRTIQNERAVMRAILQKDGRYKLAAPDNPLLSNETLGLTNTCRDGKKNTVATGGIPEGIYRGGKKESRCCSGNATFLCTGFANEGSSPVM